MDPRFMRQEVAYDGREAPGTIVIDTPNHFLYLVEPEGRAIRYGIGVGRPGFTWSGRHSVSAKKEWPDWTPPDEMVRRQPYLPHFVAGGPNNPLGARAMYLGSTLYRIHGSNEPWTIGQNVSSGCIRMRNADVIDLYDRVKSARRSWCCRHSGGIAAAEISAGVTVEFVIIEAGLIVGVVIAEKPGRLGVIACAASDIIEACIAREIAAGGITLRR
jgi:hypothetical protein